MNIINHRYVDKTKLLDFPFKHCLLGGVQRNRVEDEDGELLEAMRRSRQETQFTQPPSQQEDTDPELQQAITNSLSERQESTVRRRPTEQEVREMRLKRFNEPKKEV